MKDFTITEQYYILAANSSGRLSSVTGYGSVELIAAGILDLAAAGALVIERKRAVMRKGEEALPEYLRQLYLEIKDGAKGNLKKAVEHYMMSLSDKKRKAYERALLEALEQKGAAQVKRVPGMFREKTEIRISETVREQLAERLCASFSDMRPAGEIGGDEIFLARLMKKTGVLRKRVGREEYTGICRKLKETAALPGHKAAMELIDYVEAVWVMLISAAT